MHRIRPGLHTRLQEALDSYWIRTKKSRPTYHELASLAKDRGVRSGASAATIQRHLKEPGQRPIPELVHALADILEVRPEYLTEGEGPMTLEELRAQRRAEEAIASGGGRDSLSTTWPLDGACVLLWQKALRRWSALPYYQFRGDDGRACGPPAPDEISETIRAALYDVVRRLPRHDWSEDDRHDFVAALLNAMMLGIQKNTPGGGDFSGILADGTLFRQVAADTRKED